MAGQERFIEQGSYFESFKPQDTPLTPTERAFAKDAKKVIAGHLARTVLIVSAVLAGAGVVVEPSHDNPLAIHSNTAEAVSRSVKFTIENRTGSPQTELTITLGNTNANIVFLRGDKPCTNTSDDIFHCSSSAVVASYTVYGDCPSGFSCKVSETFGYDACPTPTETHVWGSGSGRSSSKEEVEAVAVAGGESCDAVGGIAEPPPLREAPPNNYF